MGILIRNTETIEYVAKERQINRRSVIVSPIRERRQENKKVANSRSEDWGEF